MNLSQNDSLREHITKRMGEIFDSPRRTANPLYSGKQKAFINDAKGRGMAISGSRLSKYLKGHTGGLTEDQILWTATRLGIFININFGDPVIKDGKLIYEVGDYNEEIALKELNRIFKK